MTQSFSGEPIPKTSKCLHQSVGQKDQDSYAESQKTILAPSHRKRESTMYTELGKCSKTISHSEGKITYPHAVASKVNLLNLGVRFHFSQ